MPLPSNTLGTQQTQSAPSPQQSAASGSFGLSQVSTQSTNATTPSSTPALPPASGVDQPTPTPASTALVQQLPAGVTTVNPAATLLNGSAATVAPSSSSSSTSMSTDPRKNASAAPAVGQAPPAKRGKGPWDNPQLGSLFKTSYKTKPTAPVPPPPPPAAPPVDDGYNNRVRFATNPLPSVAVKPASRAMSPPVRAPSALKTVSALSSGGRSASPALGTNAGISVSAMPSASMAAHEPSQNGTVATSQNGRTMMTTSSSEGTPVGSPSVEAKQAQEEQRKMRLRTIENRLKGSSWYELQRMFDEESLVVACAEAVPMDPQLALRLKTYV